MAAHPEENGAIRHTKLSRYIAARAAFDDIFLLQPARYTERLNGAPMLAEFKLCLWRAMLSLANPSPQGCHNSMSAKSPLPSAGNSARVAIPCRRQ